MPDLMFASLWLLLPHLKNHQKSVQILKPDKQTKPLLTQDKPTEMFKISNQPELIHPESNIFRFYVHHFYHKEEEKVNMTSPVLCG